jgi:hypothetical protein
MHRPLKRQMRRDSGFGPTACDQRSDDSVASQMSCGWQGDDSVSTAEVSAFRSEAIGCGIAADDYFVYQLTHGIRQSVDGAERAAGMRADHRWPPKIIVFPEHRNGSRRTQLRRCQSRLQHPASIRGRLTLARRRSISQRRHLPGGLDCAGRASTQRSIT